MLTVPVPHLAYEALAPGLAALELPMTVTVGPVVDEGTTLTPVELETFALITYRQLMSGSLSEVWDGQQKVWLPEGAGGPGLLTNQLAYLDPQPGPWQGTVVAAGGTDASGQPQFAKAVAGYPLYSFRAFFASRTGETSLSGPSAAVGFAGVADGNLMVLGPGDGEKPDQATEAKLQLKNTGLQVIGGLVIHRDSPGAEVTLSNAAGATVVLKPDGSIELRPAASKSVVVTSDLETERIVYRPAGGGAKQTLA